MVCCVEADAAYAAVLVEYLRGRGLTVFFYKELPAGTDWTTFIRHKIVTAYAVVVVHSKRSVGNVFLADEAMRAKKQGAYIPVEIDELSDDERLPGGLIIQSLKLDPSGPPIGAQKVKFDDDVDRLILHNGPDFYRSLFHELERTARDQQRLRKDAEERYFELAAQKGPASDAVLDDVSALKVNRAMDLADALVATLSKTLDLLEKSNPQANSSMEAMLDDVATETATKLRLLAADAAAAGDESVRRLLVLKVNGTLNELERLKKFAARPKI